MMDFNDFQPIEDTQNQNTNPLPNTSENENNNLDINQMNNMFSNMGNPPIDEEEQKRIADRQKEADERKEKINKKMKDEEAKRNEIRQKASEYLVEFEAKRQEEIAKKRKMLEEQEKNTNNTNNADSWSKVKDNIDLKDSEYKGSKDVQRMREAMMNNPNSQPLQNFFG